MKKRISALCLSAVLIFGLTACRDSGLEETVSADSEETGVSSEEALTVYENTALVLVQEDADESEEELPEEDTADGVPISEYTSNDGSVTFTCEFLLEDKGSAVEITDVAYTAAETEDAEETGEAEDSSENGTSYETVTLTSEDEEETEAYLFTETGNYEITIHVMYWQEEDVDLTISLTVVENTYIDDYSGGTVWEDVKLVSGADYITEELETIYESSLNSFVELCADVTSTEELLEVAESSGLLNLYNEAAEAFGEEKMTAKEFVSASGLKPEYETKEQAEAAGEETDTISEEELAEAAETAAASAADTSGTSSGSKTSSSSSSSKSSGSSSSKSSSSGSGSSSSSSSSHTHSWTAVYKTVHHDAVTHEETTTSAAYVCNSCGAAYSVADYGSSSAAKSAYYSHAESAHDNSSTYSYNTIVISSTTVVDQEAYDEEVIDYYECSCGATKE